MSCKMSLEEICSMVESSVFDRKSAKIDAKSLAVHLIAFANADGGTLAIGVEDDGEITGIDGYAENINELLADINGKAEIVVATAVTTKASSVIPFFPVYCIALYKVMSDKGTHETPIMHQDRIYREMIYGDKAEYDTEGRLRPDNWEIDNETQAETKELISKLNEDNLPLFNMFYNEIKVR